VASPLGREWERVWAATQSRGTEADHGGIADIKDDKLSGVGEVPRGEPAAESAPAWQRLSFTGDPEDEASVASALAEAEATGGQSPRPRQEGDPPLRTVVVGPGIKALRARRPADETALAREVSRRITAYREAHRLPQRALAERLGMPQSNLARLELGLHTPTLETLARLARELDMTFAIEITPRGIRLQLAA
jgi:ribosome-binding protein aMBF1 (putative translation factor)